MDVLWSPWRYEYIKGAGSDKDLDCVFCHLHKKVSDDAERFILRRAEFNYVVLNIFPYAPGHVLIIPYEHFAFLHEGADPTIAEMMMLTRSTQAALVDVYSPDGFNIGMNLGSAAGAGIAGHLHMHIVPRWLGDVNFITAIGGTRNLPETLDTTYKKLLARI